VKSTDLYVHIYSSSITC